MNQKLFAGFGSFETPAVPEGALQVVYGLAVDTVQVIGEATAANLEGMTPRDLAGQLASKFNMPAQGLRVFVDEKEISFEAPVPAGARVLEFRQPSGEKGGTILLPLDDKDAVLITVVRVDEVEFVVVRDEPKGKVSRDLLGLLDLGGMSVLFQGREYATIGYPARKYRINSRKGARLEAQIRRHVGGEIPGAASVVGDLRVKDLTLGHYPDLIRLNDQVLERRSSRGLGAGDRLLIVLPGELLQVDCAALAKRAAQVAELGWTRLRILGARKGIKLAGRGRTSDAIRADLLREEFPELLRDAEDEFVMAWLYPES